MRQPSSNLTSAIHQAKVSRKISLAVARLLHLQSHYAKRALCDEQGRLKPDAEKLMGLLALEARLNRHGFQSDAERRLFDLGAQHIVKLLIEWTDMDGARLARIEQQLKDDMKG